MYRKAYRLRPLACLFFVLCFLALGYLSYHIEHGKYGLAAREALQTKISKLNLDLSHLKHQRKTLDRDVALMRPEQIDPDMLDEQARRILNMAHPNDVILLDVDHY